MILETCPTCGEVYPPQVTSWLCPTCGVDDFKKKMAIFDLIEDEKE